MRDLYVVFYQGFFVPEILENTLALAEPYSTFVKAFQDFVNKNGKDLVRVIDNGDLPFWDKEIYIPKIGKITYCHKKNIPSRLLIGRRYEDFRQTENELIGSDEEYTDYLHNGLMSEIRRNERYVFSKYSYLRSNDYKKILHLPLMIPYKRKISIVPSFNYYANQFRKKRQNIKGEEIVKLEGVNTQARCYIHYYTYGLFYIHLAISLTSLTDLFREEVISWLHDLKASSTRSKKKTILKTRGEFEGTLEGLFDYLFQQTSKSLLGTEGFNVLRSPIYDSIRIKPISRITRRDIEAVEQRTTSKDRDEDVYSYLVEYGEQYFFDHWYRFEEALKKVKKQVGKLTLKGLYEELMNAKKNICNPQKTPLQSSLQEFSREYLQQDFLLNSYIKNLSDFILFYINRRLTSNLEEDTIHGLLSKSLTKTHLTTRTRKAMSYGYRSELIVMTSQSMLMAPRFWPIWSKRKQLQLFFQWKLIAINEIAFAQKMIFSHYTQKMNAFIFTYDPEGTFANPEPVTDSTRLFLNGLIELSEHLAPHHRKWYYLVAEEINLRNREKEFQRVFESYNQVVNPSLKILQELIENNQLRSVIDLREAVIRQIQIGNNNAMIIEQNEADEE